MGVADRDDSRQWRRDARECGGTTEDDLAAQSDMARAARSFERASARRGALRTFVLTARGRASTSVASAGSAAGCAGCSLVAAVCRFERLEPRSQIGDFPAQLGDLSALVDEFGGEAAQREPESVTAKLGAGSRQVRLVVRRHVAISRARTRLCPSVCLMDARCIGRLMLELDFKLALLDLEHGSWTERMHPPAQIG